MTSTAHPLWCDISFTHARWGAHRLEDPVEYARRRVEQNIIGDMSECGYQRQTGRTFRVLLKALDAAHRGKRTLIVANGLAETRGLEHKLVEWIDQVCIPTSGSRTVPGGVEILDRRKGEESLISIFSIDSIAKSPSTLAGRLYDLCLYDNAATDTEYSSPTEDFVRATQRASRACRNANMGVFSHETLKGNTWKGGDLFTFSGSSAVGTLLSIKFVEDIPIGLTALYKASLVSLPWDAIDVLQKVSS